MACCSSVVYGIIFLGGVESAYPGHTDPYLPIPRLWSMQNANGSIAEEDEDDSDGSNTDSGDDASESASTSSDVPIRGKAKWFMQGYFVFDSFHWFSQFSFTL